MPLLLLKRWKEGAIGGLALAVLFLLLQWKKTDADLKKARLAYENPAVKEVVREKIVRGPVIIKYRTVHKPVVVDGKSEVETTLEKLFSYGETVETKDQENETSPVPNSIVLAPARTDRYLLTLGLNKLSMDSDGKAIFAGYGFKNRLDIQVGVVRKEKTTPWVLATMRF